MLQAPEQTAEGRAGDRYHAAQRPKSHRSPGCPFIPPCWQL